MIRVGNRTPQGLRRGTRRVDVLMKDDRILYAAPAVTQAYAKQWVDANVTTLANTTLDSVARWFDVEIVLPDTFVGSPETGWSHEAMHLQLEWARDLQTWLSDGWITTPGTTPETLSGGKKKWFARYDATPVFWRSTLIDVTIQSDLHAKSITSLTSFLTPQSLPNFPYAMPSQAAVLQADLRAAGFTDATVTYDEAPIVARARNYTVNGAILIRLTHVGNAVTNARPANTGVTIALPNYPYVLPGDAAQLQTDLRDAGFSYTTVTLHAGTWTILLPNRLASDLTRSVDCTYLPADPIAAWDFFGNYLGMRDNNTVYSSFDNVRAPDGAPYVEAFTGFARVRLTHQ
jgi:hypothetical protein